MSEQDDGETRGSVAKLDRKSLHVLQRELVGVLGQRLVELRKQVVGEQSCKWVHRIQDMSPPKAIEAGGLCLLVGGRLSL